MTIEKNLTKAQAIEVKDTETNSENISVNESTSFQEIDSLSYSTNFIDEFNPQGLKTPTRANAEL